MVVDTDSEYIFKIFFHRCAGIDGPCGKYAVHINEIIPRSSGRESMDFKNRVPMCAECHRKYHDRGTSDEAIKKLQERREQFLISIGREDFV